MVKCGVCGATVASNLVVQLGGKTVCVNCKSSYAREMAGARPVGSHRYAGFWIRFVAVFLDGLILALPMVGLLVATGAFDNLDSYDGQANANPMPNLVMMGLYMLYSTFFIGKFGATPGKMAVKIKVIRSDGAPVSFGRAFGRYWANLLSGMICYVGYIIAAFDAEKRSLHDRICDTRVVYK
jgi:uncharacterized RDD family membrane protein YckC